MLYGRQPVRMSPVAPSFKPRSSTPVSHINGHSSALGGSGGPIEDMTRGLKRDRDGDKRSVTSVSSRGPPLGSSPLVAERDRPRSSSSSVLTTPPPSNRSVPSPLDFYPRSQTQMVHSLHTDPSHPQRDNNLPASSAATCSAASLSQAKKPDRTTTPLPKALPFPPVKVKEEKKEEPENNSSSLHSSVPSHSFDRPNSHSHHHSSGTPSSSLSLTPTPLAPPTPSTPSHLPLLDRSRAIEALVAGPERFSHPQGPPQGPHSFTWDPWREAAAQHRREALALQSDPHLALRSGPHLARLFHQRQLLEAERAAAVAAAAAAAPQHPPISTSTPSSSAVRPEFGLMAFDRPPQLGPPVGRLIDEEQRAQILREDFERVRYFGIHPHLPPGSHLSSPAAAHLEQLHHGLIPHPLSSGASAASQHHAGLYSRLGPIAPHHMPNGIFSKATADLVGALSVGAPPPLIPSITSRSSTPPRGSRLGGPGELALYSTHKDGESR